MANYSRWEDVKKKRREPSVETGAGVEQNLALGQLIYDLRTEAGLSQRELAERMGTTQSVISRLEEGGERVTASTRLPVSPRRSIPTFWSAAFDCQHGRFGACQPFVRLRG